MAELRDRQQIRQSPLRARLQGRLLFHGLLFGPAERPAGGAGTARGEGRTEAERPQHWGSSLPAACPHPQDWGPPGPSACDSQLPTRCHWGHLLRGKCSPKASLGLHTAKTRPRWPGSSRMGQRPHPCPPNSGSDTGAGTPRPRDRAPPPTQPGSRAGRAHLFSEGFTPTDSEAMAVTVSASSFSHFWASTSE